MTLADRIKLVDDMVRENPDVTIKEYLELVKEFDEVRVATIENKMDQVTVINPIIFNRRVDDRYRGLR
jgi:hypothetical protein